MKKIELSQAISFISATAQGNGVAIMHGKKVRRKVFYLAGLGAQLAAKNNKLIEQKTDKEVGITNFDAGNKLNAGRNLLVTGIRILFDTTADVTPQTASWKSEAPAAFKNGELVISQDGTGNLLEAAVGPISKYNASIATEDEFTQVVPFLIRETVPFEIQFLLAGGAAANQAYRLELDCLELVDADKA